MAQKDVNVYFHKMQKQYLDMKAILSDFEDAFKNGQITEDRLDEVKADIAALETNYQRLLYIDYLYELPVRQSKRKKFIKQNKKIEEYLKEKNADTESVIYENTHILDNLRENLKKLTESNT